MSIYGGIISVGGGGGGGGPTADWEAVSNVGGTALLTGTQFIGITNSDTTAGGLKLKEATGQFGTNPMVRFLDQAGGENAWLKVGGQHSVGFGFEAARSAVTNPGTLQKITAIGYRAGRAMAVGNSDSTFIGYDAGVLATGIDNTFIGARAGDAVTTGARNVLVGDDAGGAQTTGADNVAIGSQAGAALTTALNNVLIGTSAGALLNSANNVIIGYQAGKSSAAGGTTGNVFIGYEAGYAATTGTFNVCIGAAAGGSATSAGENTHIGYAAGYANTAVGNTYLGFSAGLNATTAVSNVFVGRNAGLAVTTGGSNTFVGHEAGKANTTGGNNTFVGNSAGDSATSGDFNTFVGSSAGAGNTTGTGNVFIGLNAGVQNTTAAGNTFIGTDAGSSSVTAVGQTHVGYQCGRYSTSNNNTLMGYYAGSFLTTGNDNLLLGAQAGFVLTGGNDNVMLGFVSGAAVTTGSNNILIGYYAGSNLTTGSSNIVIGYDTLSQSITGANTLAIGNLIFGTAIDGTGTTLSTGNIGIGIVTPLYKLDVAGSGRFVVPDGSSSAFQVIEGANTYLALSTSNGTETIQFGNTTTNPAVNFSGAGTATFSGLVDFDLGFKVKTALEGQFYNTSDETTNYERGFMRWTGNVWQIGTEKGGTGTARTLSVMVGGSTAFQVFAGGNLAVANDSRVNTGVYWSFGTPESASFGWITAGNDSLRLGLQVNNAAYAGHFIICEKADMGVDFGHAVSTDPTMFIHSSDHTTTTDWLGLWCDQTGNGHVEVGGNGLILGSSGKKMGFFGAAPSTQATGWSATGMLTDRALTTTESLATVIDVLGTLINDLKAIGLIGA